MDITPFESWFVDCIAIAANNPACPEGYVWSLQAPGVWKERFDAGMTPEDAVFSQFFAH